MKPLDELSSGRRTTMKLSHGCFLMLCLLATGSGATGARPISAAVDQPSDPNMLIRLEDDLLSVKLADAPIKAVLQEIGRQGHIAVTIQGELTKTISIDVRRLPLEEGLQLLLRDCGWIAIGKKNGRIEQLIVAQKPDGPGRGGSREAPRDGPGDHQATSPDRHADGERSLTERLRTAAAVMERTAVKTFFDVGAHTPDPVAKLQAFGELVDAVSRDEVGQLLVMLQDKNLPPATWEQAFAPLADVLSAQERTALVRSLENRAVREELVSSFEQVYLFKSAQEREQLERGGR
jgi:hypothetical protein